MSPDRICLVRSVWTEASTVPCQLSSSAAAEGSSRIGLIFCRASSVDDVDRTCSDARTESVGKEQLLWRLYMVNVATSGTAPAGCHRHWSFCFSVNFCLRPTSVRRSIDRIEGVVPEQKKKWTADGPQHNSVLLQISTESGRHHIGRSVKSKLFCSSPSKKGGGSAHLPTVLPLRLCCPLERTSRNRSSLPRNYLRNQRLFGNEIPSVGGLQYFDCDHC